MLLLGNGGLTIPVDRAISFELTILPILFPIFHLPYALSQKWDI
jgi:hypothetical protein